MKQIKHISPMSVTKEDLKRKNEELQRELRAMNEENERLKEEVIESVVEDIKEAISEERDDLRREIDTAAKRVSRMEVEVDRVKRSIGTAKDDLEGATDSLKGTIRAGMSLAVANLWMIIPVGLVAGVVGSAAERVLIDQTKWESVDVLIWSVVAAVVIPVIVGAIRVIRD